MSRRITAKIGNMRKEKGFVVYPQSYACEADTLYIQADGACAKFNTKTGVGRMSNKGSAPMDYYLIMKGQYFICPQEVIDQAIAVAVPRGQSYDTGMGLIIQG